MKRYIKIYSLLLRLNLSALLAYRANFINSVIGTVGWGFVSIASMFLLTSRVTTVYGWTREELLTVTGVYSVIIGIFHMLCSRNVERFSRIINLGQLDSILLKPTDPQFMVSLWLFNYASVFRIIMGIIFTIYMLQKMHIVVTLISFFGFIILMISGLLLLYSVWFSIITITIWFTNLTNLVDFLYGFSNLGRYPPEMIRRTGNLFLFIFLPLTFIATIPIKAILQKALPSDVLMLLLISWGFFFLTRKFFKFALRFYTSASG